jgi:hypothetical protein
MRLKFPPMLAETTAQGSQVKLTTNRHGRRSVPPTPVYYRWSPSPNGRPRVIARTSETTRWELQAKTVGRRVYCVKECRGSNRPTEREWTCQENPVAGGDRELGPAITRKTKGTANSNHYHQPPNKLDGRVAATVSACPVGRGFPITRARQLQPIRSTRRASGGHAADQNENAVCVYGLHIWWFVGSHYRTVRQKCRGIYL